MPPLPTDFLEFFSVLKKNYISVSPYKILFTVLGSYGDSLGMHEIMLYNPIENDNAFQLKNLYVCFKPSNCSNTQAYFTWSWVT